jgi:GNAT superfamily N-acetyltransferase
VSSTRPDPGPPTVRRATAADVAVLVRFSRALSREEGETVRFITAEKMLADGFGRRPEFRTHLAELDGRPVGYSFDHDAYSGLFCERGVYLMDLYVAPRARRRGVARALLAAVARAARRRGRGYVWWTSARDERRRARLLCRHRRPGVRDPAACAGHRRDGGPGGRSPDVVTGPPRGGSRC